MSKLLLILIAVFMISDQELFDKAEKERLCQACKEWTPSKVIKCEHCGKLSGLDSRKQVLKVCSDILGDLPDKKDMSQEDDDKIFVKLGDFLNTYQEIKNKYRDASH